MSSAAAPHLHTLKLISYNFRARIMRMVIDDHPAYEVQQLDQADQLVELQKLSR